MESYTRHTRRLLRGTTLAELLIATFIFGFLTMILLGIINFGTQTWKKVESRSSTEKDIRRALLDLSKTMRNTDVATFNCSGSYSKSINGKTFVVPWMAFKTAQAVELYDPEFVGFDGTTDTNRMQWTYFILYYAVPPTNDNCQGDTAAEKYCPHKILIKKFLAVSGTGTGGTDANITNKTYLSSSDVDPYLTQTESAKDVASGTEKAVDTTLGPSVSVVARNVLNFAPGFNDLKNSRSYGITASIPQVAFSLKCFKVLEYAKSGAIGTSDLASSLIPSTMSIQVDQKIIPANNYCP
ncbi:MAG: hypothetical protein RDV48_01970 [Candidatus Eremiobacteraeota bacterium]|nr:hypothetical protein [Candidatus Eremiobacteraeota bacterium]